MCDSQQVVFGAGGDTDVGKSRNFVAAPSRSLKTKTFDVSPQEIRFLNFESHHTYELPLKLKNKTKETQFVQIACPQSRFLELQPPRQQGTTTKIAPGLSVTYKVLFTPEDYNDYSYDLLVTTRYEEFTIPVHAVASRGELKLPESFTATPCPVKGTTETALFLRNAGMIDCQWRADVSAPFTLTPSSGIVPANGGVFVVNVTFAPRVVQRYQSVIVFYLGPEEDVTQELQVFGDAIEVAVVLEQNTVDFPKTFVTLENQAVVCVRNDSDYTVNFSWKSDQNEVEEQLVIDRQLPELSEDMKTAMSSAALTKAAQSRLFDERLKVLSKEGRIFDDDVFALEPIRGVIYAKGKKEFVVTFNPQLATGYFATAYLDISGKMKRLPLQIKGTGIGPQCELEYRHLDIGDVFLGALHEYKVAIFNKSCIEARYKVLPQNTLMGRKFTFSPSEGVLAPGEEETLCIQLQSDLIGLISETFSIHLHGSLEDLTLRFRGRVTGPSLEFSVEELDFGNVSFDCLHSRTVLMKNIGKVPIRFHLRIPELLSPRAKVTVSPAEGLVLPNEEEEICVNFVSDHVGNCETELLVDVDGIGDKVDSLPIKAACLVPELQIFTNQLHYGTCFVGHEYTMNLELVNKTALVGKYIVVLVDNDSCPLSDVIISINSEEDKEPFKIIEPRSRSSVPVKLKPLVVGNLRMTFYVRVLGSSEAPLPVLLTATVRGPIINVEPKSLSFGVLTLLEHATQSFVISNTSPIPAVFSTCIVRSGTLKAPCVFSIDQTEGEISPYSSTTVNVTACLTDSRNFSEKIQVTVKYAEDNAQIIAVTAKGKGYALVPVGPIDKIDFGDVFTATRMEKTILIANKGQRDVDVLWSCSRGTRPKVGGQPNVFSVSPEYAVIPSGELSEFTFYALAEEVGNITEEFALKDKKEFKLIFNTLVTGNFIKPMITYSTKKVIFDYTYGVDGEEGSALLVKTFTMKNETSQPLQVILKRLDAPAGEPSPFSLVGPSIFMLASGETQIVGVNCDAFYRGDYVAHTAKGRLLVSFANHSFKEYVSVVANLAFPTICIEPERRQVNFGSILVDTEGRYQLTLTNLSSSVAAEFSWKLENLDSQGDSSNRLDTIHKRFDIVPFRGTIPPGGKRIVEAVFYGTRGRHEAIATCMLKGGPSYKVNFIGWSDVSVHFDCTSIDFGIMHYEAHANKNFFIYSPLRVAVPFTVDISSLKQPGSVKVKPMKGIVTNKVMLTVTFSPVIPEEINETFFVQVGHLDPQPITVRGLGQTYSILVTTSDKHVTLTRVEDATFLRCREELKDSDWLPYHKKSGSTAEPRDVDFLVLEAERLAYCRNLLATRSSSPASEAGSTTHYYGLKPKKEKKITVLSSYMVNFGHMVWNETRSVKLQLINTSLYSTSVHVVKPETDAGTTSLSVTPKKIPSIAQFSKTEITLSLFCSDSENVVSGANQFQLFLDIHKGPRIVFDVRCFVATPVMTSCESSLNFGDLFLGRIKKMQLHFCNNEVVPCTWKLTLVESKRKSQLQTETENITDVNIQTISPKKRQFRVNKDKGTLPPNSCMTIQVTFMSLFLGIAKAKLRFSFASNPEDHFISLIGNVVKANVELSPFPLVFPATFPYQTIMHSFTITNNEDNPLEVFCIHADQKHRVEVNILRRALMMQRAENIDCNEFYIPIREAGGFLPESLLNFVFSEQQSSESLLESAYPEGIEDRLTEKRATSRASSKRGPSPRGNSFSRTSLAQQKQELQISKKSDDLMQTLITPQVVILTGPSFSGKSTQTQNLMEKLSFLQLDLDAMVRAEAEFDTAEGECIRTILSAQEENASFNFSGEDVVDEHYNNNNDLQNKNFNESKVVKVLYTLLTRNLSNVSPLVGVLIDDIKSILTSDREEVLFAIERAVSFCKRKLYIISIAISEATSGLRCSLEKQQKCRNAVEETMTPHLTEEEYEELNEKERDIYNRRLLKYNICKRELDQVTSDVLHYSDELKNPQATIQEVVDVDIIQQEEQELLVRAKQKKKKQQQVVSPKIKWNQLSELEQFKQLYKILRCLKDMQFIVINGETSKEKLTRAIIENVSELFDVVNSTKSITPQQAEDPSLDQESFLYSFLYQNECELITEESLLSTNFPLVEQLRLFSVVQREMMIKKPQKGIPIPSTTAFEELSRWIVPAKSSIEVTAVFCGEKLGKFSSPLLFGITGTSQVITLPVVALTAYPEVCRDEKKIFSSTKLRSTPGKQQSRVFIISKRTYEFGPLIIPCELGNTPTQNLKKNKVIGDNVHCRSSQSFLKDVAACDTLTFTNVGIFPAEVSLTFGREKENTFFVSPNKFTLPVGEKMNVVLCAAPEVIGEVSSMLVMTVRDNPTPWFVYVSCIGTRPAVTLDGRKDLLLQYGRCLITRKVEKVIKIANVSLLLTRWRISDIDKLPNEFELSSTSGVLDVNGEYPLQVIFKPTKPGVHNVVLKLEVTDAEDTLFESLPVTIKAEAHDAVVEWSRAVDFKLMHVGETKRETIRILNKSPYDVAYRLRLPKALQNIITLNPSEGVLRGLVGFKDASFVSIDASLRLDREGEIPAGLGIIEACFFDPTTNELHYPPQSIPVSGEAWYNRFTIKPSCIDFGSCIMNQKKESVFEIRNTGHFTFNFQLFNYKDTPAVLHQEEDEKNIKKHHRSTKVEHTFQLGAFSVTPSSGVIAVGEKVVFTVSTVQTVNTKNREILGIYVDHCDRELEMKGTSFELVASPTIPGIVADLSSNVDIETVFEEQQIVTSLCERNESLRAFAKESRTFSFGTVLVGGRVEERFRIANSSPLLCPVKLQLLQKGWQDAKEKEKEKDKKEKEKEALLVLECFHISLDGETENNGMFNLSPFESRFVTVSFSPSTLATFNALFEAAVVGASDTRTQLLRFELTGKGVLPKLEYIFPPRLQIPFAITLSAPQKKGGRGKVKESRKLVMTHVATQEPATSASSTDLIQLPLTLIGSTSSREFIVRNTGNIDVHIRLTAPNDCPCDIQLCKLKEDIFLPAGGFEKFTFTFIPVEVVRHRVLFRVSVRENPYEDRDFWLVAESYFDSVTFDNIDPCSEKELTLGYWYLAKPKEHIVTLRNNSPYTIRFNLDCPSEVVQCSPTVGHMAAGTFKPLTFRLYTETAIGESIQCTLNVTSIEIMENSEWDNAKTKARWVMLPFSEETETTAASHSSETDVRSNRCKVYDVLPEPQYNVTKDLVLQKTLFVSYVCEPTSYKVTLPMNGDVEAYDLTFPLTKIFQRRSTTLRVTNTGHNVLPFSFELGNINTEKTGSDEDNDGVFSVEPAVGEVQPLTYCDVCVTFAPRYVERVTQGLIGNFPHSEQPTLSLLLQGSAECPFVHFNVPPCDYLSTRVEGEVGPDLDPETIPIVFRACGLQSKSVVSFKVINPSATTYKFEWMSDPLSRQISSFRCLTQFGSISAGKQYEMIFDYTATSIGIRESKWTFFIPGHMAVPFLLVGKGEEPNVFLNLSKVNFCGVTVGSKEERVLMLENKEDISFPFAFDRASFEGENSCISVKPISGTISPKSSLPITVAFTPKEEISVNARLACRIKRLSDPLTINVKGEGLRLHCLFTIEDDDSDGSAEVTTVPPSQTFPFNLGRVQVDTVLKKRLVLTNEGQLAMDFVMVLPEHKYIDISPLSGTVGPKQSTVMMLVYSPKEEETLRKFKVQCRVEKTLFYTISFKAVSYVPKIQFSFNKFDFGPCFIFEYSSGMVVSTTLNMTNCEVKEAVSLDCTLSNEDVFELDSASFLIFPGETRQLKISFSPREVGSYNSELKVVFNNNYSVFIPLLGEGIMPYVDVPIRFLKLGAARIGERRSVELRLECRSRAATPISLANSVDAFLVEKGVSFSPNDFFVLQPREVRVVTVFFKPTMRMPEFQREVRMLVCGREMPLAIISGSCEDAEVHLDLRNILFDDVVIGSSATRRVVIMNSGDISQRFRWDTLISGNEELKVIPSSGFVRSHAEHVCEVVYAPKKAKTSFRRVVSVEFDAAPPLFINVEAHGIEPPKANAVLSFSCEAKSSVTKTVSVENPTDVLWTVKPTVDNRLWTTPKTFNINPKSTAMLSVTYSPLFTSKEKDVATLFIPFPNGSAQRIQLEGVVTHSTEKEALQGKVVETGIPHKETFILQNGTSQPLRFYSSVNWTPEPEKGMVNIKMPVSVDVPAKQRKEFSVVISSLKEGNLYGKFEFKCVEHEDCNQTFDLPLLVVPKTVSSKTELIAPVRTSAIYRMPITNPFDKNITVTTKVENGSDCVFVEPSIVIPRKSTSELVVRFFPLINKEYPIATVIASNPELGITSCKLSLRSTSAAPEKALRISCCLGKSVIFPLSFAHYSKASCEFTVRLSSKTTCFTKVGAAATVKMPGTTRPEGQPVSIDIQYEPTAVGDIKDVIEVVSPSAGTYVFPILATCLPPEPQGPFIMRTGQATLIPFKNIFNEAVTFSLVTDSPSFVVSKTSENIAAKKTISISVTYKSDEDRQTLQTSRLTVSCVYKGNKLQWVFYLKHVQLDDTFRKTQAQKKKNM